METLKWTGERLVTSLNHIHGKIEHLHRYGIAQQLSKGKVVLDIASGEGYGTNLLGIVASKVYGVDIDRQSIEHGRRKYQGMSNIEFLEGSTSLIPLANGSIDLVVSFETLEHHDEHEQMMEEILRVLKPDGIMLISSPEKSIYKRRDPNNPFHIKELEFANFKALLERYFKYNCFFTQRFVIGSLIHNYNVDKIASLKFFDGDFDYISEGLNEEEFYNSPFFNLALCSNFKIEDSMIFNSIFNGVSVINNQISSLQNEIEHLKMVNLQLLNSRALKMQKVVTNALKVLKIKK